MCVYRSENYFCSRHSTEGRLWLCVGDKCPDYTMSNADMWRSMTDEDLAAYLARNNVNTICDIVCGGKCKAVAKKGVDPWTACRKIVEEWLKKPSRRNEASEEQWQQAVERMGKK